MTNTDAQLHEMLRTIGVSSFEELLQDIPPQLRAAALEVPRGLSEAEVVALCEELAGRNHAINGFACFLGAGAYRHLIPTVVDALSARGEWLTPYTPYQAEASQGTLQAIYEFQSMICELFQMDVANASLYDGASALAEAVVMALRATERPRILVSEAVHPHVRQVMATYVGDAKTILQTVPTVNGVTDLEAIGQAAREDVACLILQQPNVFGCLEPMVQAGELAHRVGGFFIASTYPMSLGGLQPPGAYGADIAVGEGQCLGNPLAYGGPGLGLFTTTTALLRRVPGRIAGCTLDAAGHRAFTLTLQTREQHIRRERATSNICTNQGWLALRATIFLSLLGPEGMRELAQQNLDAAHEVQRRLCELGWLAPTFDQPFFNEFALNHDPAVDLDRVNRRLARRRIIGGLSLRRWYPMLPQASLWCATERTGRNDVDRLIETLKDAVR